jgi:hypothetical protein
MVMKVNYINQCLSSANPWTAMLLSFICQIFEVSPIIEGLGLEISLVQKNWSSSFEKI